MEGKNTVVSLTLALSIIAVIVSLSLPNVYQSEAILAVVSEGTTKSMQNIGGLASLAGINIKSQPAGNSTKH